MTDPSSQLFGRPYKLNIDVGIFALESLRQQLLPKLKWATPAPARRSAKLIPQVNQTGVTGTSTTSKGKGKETASSSKVVIPAEPGETPAQTAERQRRLQMTLNALKRADERTGDEVLDALTDEIDILALPFPKNPPSKATGDLLTDLLPHQQQALRWMRRAEDPKLPTSPTSPPVQLISYATRPSGSPYWVNLASRQCTTEKPPLARGGMLCDAMGLGKTLEVLALVVDTLEHKPEGFEKATLIVCPVSVISNWVDQITAHVSPEVKLTYHVCMSSPSWATCVFEADGSLKITDPVATSHWRSSANLTLSSPPTQLSPLSCRRRRSRRRARGRGREKGKERRRIATMATS